MRRFDEPILVTRPYMPPIDEFRVGLEEIWRNRHLTNDGPVLRRFHKALAKYMAVPDGNLALFCNGTLALELGYSVMGLSGAEVITTPFTFLATSHALKRIGATPKFADIDPETLCLSPEAAEKLITPRTKAIVPVHVYGNACDTQGFSRLGEKYGIKIIYDAAHAFGVRELVGCGDMSMWSFHSTKLFHSCEGGMLVFKETALQSRLFDLRNFAIHSETECVGVGSNAKMSELHALVGLECLKHIDEITARRREIYEAYERGFADCQNVKLSPYSKNKAYVTILLKDFATRERVYDELRTKCNVFARRYFYPLLTAFGPYAYGRGLCPVAEAAASRVLALPTYHELSTEDVAWIARNVVEMVS